jgi:Tol biopolymer transport system component
MNRSYFNLLLAAALLTLASPATAEDATPTAYKGVYNVDGRLHVSLFGTPDRKPITAGPNDLKPSWSKTGDKIVFFRTPRLTAQVSSWKTAICVVNADGSGFRKLTDGTQTDFNPTWSRDGKGRIYFSRRDPVAGRFVVHTTTADAKPGDEVAVSDPASSSYVHSCLKDGRIFVTGWSQASRDRYFLLTPGIEGKAKYEPVVFTPVLQGMADRVSVSPSETKVCYELQKGRGAYQYPGRTLYIADFDVATRTVSNPKAITDTQPDPKVLWLYPCWTSDEKAVVYYSDKTGKPQLYMYRLADGSTICVSTNPGATYKHPCAEATPK